MENPTNDAAPEKDWVEDGVIRSALGTSFSFVVVLLVSERYRDVLREAVKVGVVGDDRFVFLGGEEHDVTDC